MAVDFDLGGKWIMVTGATSGLGKSFTQALCEQGANVIATGRRTPRLEVLAADMAGQPGQVAALSFDVNDRSASSEAIAKAWDISDGALWGLVNNSGVQTTAPIEDTTEDEYDFVMDTNVKAAFFMTTEIGKRFIARGNGGRVVNIASIAAFKTLVLNSVYCMSKAATAHMTKCFAREWARYQINVNAICPGFIETEINSDFFKTETGEKFIKRFPRRRVGHDTDLNELLLYLLSPASGFVTGSTIVADDGQVLA
ncbi:MAG: SDR family NAD(P)-dependent oxidoreductase [Pseudomonadota bacterium]